MVTSSSLICLTFNIAIYYKVKRDRNTDHKTALIKKMLGMDFISDAVTVTLHTLALLPPSYVKYLTKQIVISFNTNSCI